MDETDELARNKAAALRIFKNTVGDLPPEQMSTKEGREAVRGLIVNAIKEINEGGMMLPETYFDELLVYATKRKPQDAGFKEIKASLANELPLIVDEKRVERAEIAIENIMNGIAGHPGTPRNERDMAIVHALIEKGERDMNYVKRAARAIEERTGGLTFELAFIDKDFVREFNKQLGIMGQDEFVDPREERKALIRDEVKKIVNDCYHFRGMVIPKQASDEDLRELVVNEIDGRIMRMLLDAGESDAGLIKETFQGNYAAIWSPDREYLNADLKPETFLEQFDRVSQENRARAKAEVDRAKKQSKEWKAAKIAQSERIRKSKVAGIEAQIMALEKENKTASPDRRQEIEKMLPALTSRKFSINLWQSGYRNRLMAAETIQKVEDALGKDWKRDTLVELATGFLPPSNVAALSKGTLDEKRALDLLGVLRSALEKIDKKSKAGGQLAQEELSFARRAYYTGENLARMVGDAPFSDRFGITAMALRGAATDITGAMPTKEGKARARAKFSTV